MIDVQRWKRLSGLIDEAWALEPAAREAWLLRLAATEPGLATQVRDALAAEGDPDATVPHFENQLASALRRRDDGPDLAGTRLGAWKLEARIGQGGMGQVWRAGRADGMFQGWAAIKLLRSDIGSSPLARRFERERALLARLNHPAIARLLDAGIAGADAGPAAGQAYLVLELATGDSLNEHARAHCPTLASRVRLLLKVAEAVAYAHSQLVVHRDLKPANVLVTPEGQPKLLDFGIAALLEGDSARTGDITRLTGRALTPGYAAPEQISGGAVGTATDVFALGVMLYELATGTLPFGRRGASGAEHEKAINARALRPLADAAAADDAQGPGRPADRGPALADLQAVCFKALQHDAAARYASAGGFIADLQAWLDHRPVAARGSHWAHDFGLWLRRHAVMAGAGALVVAALGASLATTAWQRSRALDAAQQSAEVTAYLGELLASSSPDLHGGNWPTVLQLLEKSRAELPKRFADSPDTRLRVLQVMTETYRRLNRLDVSVPMAQQLVAESRQRYGQADERTLRAVFELAQSQQLQGQCDLSIADLDPALPHYRKAGGELALMAVSLSMVCHARLGRLDDAERLLAEEDRLVQALPADDPWRWGYLNHVHVLRVQQGRLREALDAISKTKPFWTTTDPSMQREVLTMERNHLAAQIAVAEYDRVEERLAALLARSEKLLGPGSSLGLSLRGERARYRADTGNLPAALDERDAALRHARQAGVQLDTALLPLQVQRLAARAAARAAPPAALLAETRTLLDQARPLAPRLGLQRAELWLTAARVALAQDDAALAAEAMALLEQDRALNLAPGPQQNVLLAARKLQADGQLARLKGDLDASARALSDRLRWYDRSDEKRQIPAWQAALDYAYTRVLQKAPDAGAAIAHAATRRPAAVPQDHPLDAVAAYLGARLAAGRDDAPEVKDAAVALQRALQRDPDAAPAAVPLRGALGGAL